MKDEYVLYLDESEVRTSKTFAIAGFAVKKDQVHYLQGELLAVKQLIWSEEFILNNKPVLHCTELQQVFNERNNDKLKNVRAEYNELIKKSPDDIEKLYNQIYGRIARILKKCNATVFCCIIKMRQLYDLFYLDETHNGTYLFDDKYNIALQKIIENYTHYLSVNDGYGDVVYEARNNMGENSHKSPDNKLINDYHRIQANNRGIVYTDNVAVQNRNRTIMVHNKIDDLAGLQIADFIAYNMIKYENCKESKQLTDFMKQIHRLSYNGGHTLEQKDQRSFWGVRVLPSYLRMEELLASNKSLKNAYDNLKKERNKLKKTIERNNAYIAQLEEQNKKMSDELEKTVDRYGKA